MLRLKTEPLLQSDMGRIEPLLFGCVHKTFCCREGCLRFSKACATPRYLQEAQQGGSRLRIVGDALEDRIKTTATRKEMLRLQMVSGSVTDFV